MFNKSSTYCGPQIELLVIPDCPYATLAEALIAVTLNKLDLSHAPVITTVIATTAEAARRRFTGSPSIVINGVDPWANPMGNPASPAASIPPRPDCPPHTISPRHCLPRCLTTTESLAENRPSGPTPNRKPVSNLKKRDRPR
ncbi:hypothetical protein MGAD_33580 [Mycolicibacterium gadium]|uniref:Alkylmercury lyase n=1 Tax=Mycolicibacterium gadium TaxID=1794 RepID=A0A7I7WRG3_MYCGU|nr:hypothetical protein MGAD_33580 [Mycolicibacterium gadium]